MFFDQNLLLYNETGKALYETVKTLPIIDYHCHLDQKKIANNDAFSDIGELWLAGDHYKWRAMRMNGVEESYITGKASYHEKFLAYAKWLRTVSAGNYHKDTIRYVLFEILAEYKRHGVSKTAVVKAMLALGPVFAARELVRRKKAAREDIRKCTLAAKAAGLKQTGGTQQFPIFGE